MRTRGAMGRMVNHMTRADKRDLFDTLARIEQGIQNATGKLDVPQTTVELEDIQITVGARSEQSFSTSNVAIFPTSAPSVAFRDLNLVGSFNIREDIFAVETIQASNVIHVQERMLDGDKANGNDAKNVINFPETFYQYFEVIDQEDLAS